MLKKENKRDSEKKSRSYGYVVKPQKGRTLRVNVTDGRLKGKSALIIKMPDRFSSFFPEMNPKICDEVSE